MKTILIIDDDPLMLRQLLAMLREEFKVVVLSVVSGLSEVILRVQPDVILMDICIPDASAEALVHSIREALGQREYRLILMSGTVDAQRIEALRATGAHAFIQKPFAREALLSAIDQCRN